MRPTGTLQVSSYKARNNSGNNIAENNESSEMKIQKSFPTYSRPTGPMVTQYMKVGAACRSPKGSSSPQKNKETIFLIIPWYSPDIFLKMRKRKNLKNLSKFLHLWIGTSRPAGRTHIHKRTDLQVTASGDGLRVARRSHIRQEKKRLYCNKKLLRNLKKVHLNQITKMEFALEHATCGLPTLHKRIYLQVTVRQHDLQAA